MRIPNAAKTLIRQMAERFPDAVAHCDDLDGFQTYRSVRYEGEAAEFVKVADLALSLDPRVLSVVTGVGHEGPAATVTFVADARADHKAPEFPLDEVAAIVPLETSHPDSESEDEGYNWDLTEDDLRAMKVAQLRDAFPEFADLKKADIIEAVLDEGIVKRL